MAIASVWQTTVGDNRESVRDHLIGTKINLNAPKFKISVFNVVHPTFEARSTASIFKYSQQPQPLGNCVTIHSCQRLCQSFPLLVQFH